MGVILKDTSVSSDASVSSWIRTPYGVRLSENPAKSFSNLLEMEKFVMAQDSTEDNEGTIAEWMSVLESSKLGNGDMNKDGLADGDVFYSKQNYTDTRVGGNDAINPYWQFNRDDDITPPSLIMRKQPDGGSLGGMGRVYNEVYDANQQILWLSMGVPEYVNLISFYRDAGDINAARAMNRGTLRGIAGKLIKLVFSATIWAITFPITAPFWVNRWISRIQTERISKYYYFKPSMVLYYEMVNTMLSYLAVSMGLYPQVIMRRKDSTKVLHAQYAQLQGEPDPEQSMITVSSVTNSASMQAVGTTAPAEQTQQPEPEPPATPVADLINSNIGATSTNGQKSSYTGQVSGVRGKLQDTGVNGVAETQVLKDDFSDRLQNKPIKDSGIPELLQNGPDIFAIINRRAMMFNQSRFKYTTRMLMDEMMGNNQTTGNQHWTTPDTKYVTDKDGNVTAAADPPDAEKTGAWANTWSSLKSNVLGAGDYVGFRVERGVNCTESISNQTGPTGIAQKLNSYAQKNREAYENYGNSWVAKTVGKLMENPGDFFSDMGKDVASSLASGLGLGDIGAVLTQGNGFLDIPDVWKGSSFSRSYSFNIQLRARYGDPVSIFQSVYIPLIMLLAAAMPRSVGNSMYTSPFLIKAYCKGMFAVPCGVIESMSISRGKDEFGWSYNHLPTSIDVNIQIKDMTPTFFLSMQDIGLFDTFSRTDNMMEYLDTLSALGITERLYFWPKAMRKLTAAMLIKRNTIFNSNYWGVRIGRNNVARLIAAVTPFANHEKSDMSYGNITGGIFGQNTALDNGANYIQN